MDAIGSSGWVRSPGSAYIPHGPCRGVVMAVHRELGASHSTQGSGALHHARFARRNQWEFSKRVACPSRASTRKRLTLLLVPSQRFAARDAALREPLSLLHRRMLANGALCRADRWRNRARPSRATLPESWVPLQTRRGDLWALLEPTLEIHDRERAPWVSLGARQVRIRPGLASGLLPAGRL